MKKTKTKNSVRQNGFSLLELLVVVAIILGVAAFAGVSMQTAQKNGRVDAAYATTLQAIRKCAQIAVGERVQCFVTFSTPRTIVTRKINAGITTVVGSIDLPTDMEFRVDIGLPTGIGLTPDGFGAGIRPLDFSIDYGGVGTSIYFQPDGTARDSVGRINNGVMYIGRQGDLLSYRAITLYGYTGRVKGWRLIPKAGGIRQWQ